MAKVNGKNGVVKIRSAVVGHITSYSFEENLSFSPQQELGQLVAEQVQENYSWTASLSLYRNKDDAGQKLMATSASGEATLLSVEFHPEGTGSGKPKLSGQAVITSKSSELQNGAYITLSVSLQGTTVLTEGTQ